MFYWLFFVSDIWDKKKTASNGSSTAPVNYFALSPLDYAQHDQQHQHHQQQLQQQQPGYPNSFEQPVEEDEKITVSYYDQQGVMQTYTYGQGRI